MAITLEANYAKKLGLPNYSSHQYSVTIRTELTDLTQVAAESARLYQVLQDAVDHEIQEVGFMPDASTYGMLAPVGDRPPIRASGHAARPPERLAANGHGDVWKCSEKQQNLIEKIVEEHHVEKRDVESMAVEMFGAGVRQLNRLQASGLIDELLDRYGGGRRQAKSRARPSRPSNHGERT